LPVPRDDFSDATLIVLGHGSTKNDESSAPVYQHCAELRRRKVFSEVREAFWKQEPQIKNVLGQISTPEVFIAPLFISEGYFSTDIIPRELGFAPGQSTVHTRQSTLFYCSPIGTHDRMISVVMNRAAEVASRFPFPRAPRPAETTLFIAGHGTEQNVNSRKAIERQVALAQATKEYAAVHAVFLEEEPRIEKCYELAQTRNIIVVPFFISDGMHTQEDIPVLLGEPKPHVQEHLANHQPTWRNPTERKDKLVWYASAVGTEPLVADIILERVREMAGERTNK
jgi:sirohydrochlorin cobaltochelatase